MSTDKTWIILTSGDQPIEAITSDLETKGFKIDATLEAIGQIIAKGPEGMKTEALNIKGVTDIFPSHDDINLGAPDSDLTW
jgi:hypothetical protein